MLVEALDDDGGQSGRATGARHGTVATLRAVLRTPLVVTDVAGVIDGAPVRSICLSVAVSLSGVLRMLSHCIQRPLSEHQEDRK